MKIYHGPPTAAFCVGVARLLKSPNERLKANADFPKKLMKIDQHYESEKIFLRSEKDINWIWSETWLSDFPFGEN